MTKSSNPKTDNAEIASYERLDDAKQQYIDHLEKEIKGEKGWKDAVASALSVVEIDPYEKDRSENVGSQKDDPLIYQEFFKILVDLAARSAALHSALREQHVKIADWCEKSWTRHLEKVDHLESKLSSFSGDEVETLSEERTLFARRKRLELISVRLCRLSLSFSVNIVDM